MTLAAVAQDTACSEERPPKTRATRSRRGAPSDPGPAAEAAVRPADPCDLQARFPGPHSRGQRRQRAVVHQPGGGRGDLQPDQPVLRRCAAPADDLRAGDHALHHREHHPAAAGGGDPILFQHLFLTISYIYLYILFKI